MPPSTGLKPGPTPIPAPSARKSTVDAMAAPVKLPPELADLSQRSDYPDSDPQLFYERGHGRFGPVRLQGSLEISQGAAYALTALRALPR